MRLRVLEQTGKSSGGRTAVAINAKIPESFPANRTKLAKYHFHYGNVAKSQTPASFFLVPLEAAEITEFNPRSRSRQTIGGRDKSRLIKCRRAAGGDKLAGSHRLTTSKGKSIVIAAAVILCSATLQAETSRSNNVCPRPQVGAPADDAVSLHSINGVLELRLIASNEVKPDGTVRYCYTDGNGHESPTLRAKPGDLVLIHLKNEFTDPDAHSTGASRMPVHHHALGAIDGGKNDPCTSGVMSAVSTNLHFHGLTIPPVCHQDDVMKTSVQPGDPPFEYRFRIPVDEPPGLYWYHPHIHGYGKRQSLGGASGALIVEGIERQKKVVAGLPERVFIIRDQDLVNPNASPAKTEGVTPKFLIDRDGDAANNGTGFGKPAKDLSINYVPVPYPDYSPAIITMKPGERQLWRVLNASAITYVNLALLFHNIPQPMDIVAMDGVPMTHNQDPQNSLRSQTHIALAPGARAEFIVTGPAQGDDALFVTRTVDTGPGGENDPNRMLAKIVVSPDAPEPVERLAGSSRPSPPSAATWLGDVSPVRVRRLYFSEKLTNPNDPTSAVEFYLTVDGQEAKMFDMNSGGPNIVAKQGTVEDWIIENRSRELHAFHIHQLHFQLLDYAEKQVNEQFVRDTINVPYFDGHSLTYPSIRVRMDFRDPNTVGTFLYHCHLLEHEDKGMMGSIRVDPASR